MKVIHTIVETIIYPETSGKKIKKNKQAYETQSKNINFATQHRLLNLIDINLLFKTTLVNQKEPESGYVINKNSESVLEMGKSINTVIISLT